MAPGDINRLLSAKEAAYLLCISPQTLRKEITEGKIEVIRVRGRVLIDPKDLEEYKKRCRR